MLRRNQTPVSFRSDMVAAELRRRARPGVSQARLVEEAFEKTRPPEPLSPSELDREQWLAMLEEILSQIPKGSVMSMTEFDALEYDENGDLRDR